MKKNIRIQDEYQKRLERYRKSEKGFEKEIVIGNYKDKQVLTRDPTSEEFLYNVKVCGGSCHIMISRRWLGKQVRVKIEEVKE